MSDARARALIEPHLWAGEELLWCDQPIAAGPVAYPQHVSAVIQTLLRPSAS
jgi:hypothetical protein